MLSFFRWTLFFIALFVTLMGGALLVGHALLTAQGPLAAAKHVVIPRGAGPATMAKVLREEGVISYPRLFRVALMIDPTPKPIKAGEYEVPAHACMQALVDLLQSGKVVQRRLTVPEGTTISEIVELVRKTEALSGEITLDLKEGDLLPETYFYSRDDTRDGLLSRMKEAMDKTLDEAWRKRAAGLPLANRRDALILASMIEKETAIAAERARVSAVFVNRLRQKMRLESDPTTIYELTGGKGSFGRDLTRADLQSSSPYNTYMIPSLPPGPICNPGRASILAATNPARDRSIYFVADGQGGHVFAISVADHNRNVARWKDIQRQRQEQGPAPGAVIAARAGDPEAKAMPAVFLALVLLAAIAFGIAWFLRANPSSLSRTLRPLLVGLGGIGIARLLIVALEFLPTLLPELFRFAGVVAATLIARALRQRSARGFSSPGAGQRTAVRTAFLEAWIDHATGDVGGTVLSGRFVGRTLDGLADGELHDLHAECASDPDSAKILEAYLDRRLGADWRRARQSPQGPRVDMTREEALAVLGSAEGASDEEIRAAHRRLIQRVHPDVGGSADLAARINRAKDVLLGV